MSKVDGSIGNRATASIGHGGGGATSGGSSSESKASPKSGRRRQGKILPPKDRHAATAVARCRRRAKPMDVAIVVTPNMQAPASESGSVDAAVAPVPIVVSPTVTEEISTSGGSSCSHGGGLASAPRSKPDASALAPLVMSATVTDMQASASRSRFVDAAAATVAPERSSFRPRSRSLPRPRCWPHRPLSWPSWSLSLAVVLVSRVRAPVFVHVVPLPLAFVAKRLAHVGWWSLVVVGVLAPVRVLGPLVVLAVRVLRRAACVFARCAGVVSEGHERESR